MRHASPFVVLALLSLLVPLASCKDARPIEWTRQEVDIGGVTLSAELVATAATEANAVVADTGDFATNILWIPSGELSEALGNADSNTGMALARAISEGAKGIQASYKRAGVSVAGMTGVEFKLDGSGPAGRGLLRAVGTGSGGLLFLCGTRGSIGVGKRIKTLEADVCPRFFENVWTQ